MPFKYLGELEVIPAGATILVSSGEYSDYGVSTVYVALKDCDMSALALEIKPEGGFSFLKELVARGFLEEKIFWELWSGSRWDEAERASNQCLEAQKHEPDHE